MKKIGKYSIIFGSIVLGIFLIIGVFKKIPFSDVISSFQHATHIAVIGFLAVSLIMMILQAWRWQIIIKIYGQVPFWKVFLYKIVGYGISFITPAAKVGGEPLRAMMLQRHKINFRKGFSTVTIDKLIDLSTTGLLFIIGILVAISTLALPKKTTAILLGFFVIIAGLIVWFYFMIMRNKRVLLKIFRFFRLNKIKKLEKIENSLIEMDDIIIRFHKEHKKEFNKALFISAINWFLMFLEYKTALLIVGITGVGFAGIFLIITMMGLAYLVPIPLALGVLEAGQVSVFSFLNLESAAAIGLSTIIRFRDLLWTLFAVIILVAHGMNFKKAYKESVEHHKLQEEENYEIKNVDSKVHSKKQNKKKKPIKN